VQAAAESGPRHIAWDYLDDSMGALQAADFYLGRSGAATVGELLAAGLPSLLIPDRQHADRQQYGNAAALVQRGQGQILDERELNGAVLLNWLRQVWDRPRLRATQPSAAQLIAAELESFMEAAAGV
jgi:UDP-N-acetylglucosamine--N-acetylmuramyl-(pentapeptide) pyrophosphoryl-undecaprenol N-acetylglucosamine transferase